MDFSGKETLSQIEKPDMFGQQAFDELFPMAVRSETAAIRALKNYDMISNPSPMFVHMQVDYLEDEAGEEYKLHQSQFYNSNFQDARNPRVTVLSLTKLADKDNPSPQAQKDTRLGNMLVKTEDYIKDLKRLKITKTVS